VLCASAQSNTNRSRSGAADAEAGLNDCSQERVPTGIRRAVRGVSLGLLECVVDGDRKGRVRVLCEPRRSTDTFKGPLMSCSRERNPPANAERGDRRAARSYVFSITVATVGTFTTVNYSVAPIPEMV
jgi:hypothetical protein